MSLTTLVLGASPKSDRYSNLAVRRLVSHGHPVIAVGRRPGVIEATPIVTEVPPDLPIDTVTLYMNADNQRAWEDRILAWAPRRIIFNPGAENERLSRRATAKGIVALEACTLVMLSTGQY
ncbi:MAG: CoA-binding protein [Flavobacteriales bacterium]